MSQHDGAIHPAVTEGRPPSDADPVLLVTDQNVSAVLEGETGVLILSKTDCGHCGSYVDDIARLKGDGRLADTVVVGRMILDRPGSIAFKRDNPWIRDLEVLPYTVVYKSGRKVDEFAASKAAYLATRLRRL